MACCSWEDFEDGLRSIWLGHGGVDTVLIDWDKAKIAWGRYHATPGEFARAEIAALKAEGDYIRLSPAPRAGGK